MISKQRIINALSKLADDETVERVDIIMTNIFNDRVRSRRNFFQRNCI
jgi:hypothetical protein